MEEQNTLKSNITDSILAQFWRYRGKESSYIQECVWLLNKASQNGEAQAQLKVAKSKDLLVDKCP